MFKTEVGKCKVCKKRKQKLVNGICTQCNSIMMKEAIRKGRNNNPFIG